MKNVTVYLKGWNDAELLTEAANIDAHPLHAEASAAAARMFRPFREGDVYYVAVQYTVPEVLETHFVLSDAFHKFNVGEDTDPVVAEYRGARNRSLSVGDVVVVGDDAFACDNFGWTLLPDWELVLAPH